MKIKSIFIRNLTSLGGDHFIDFADEPLASARLFAITGPTGAGKSSILDAICLALYDKCPRLNQANKNYLLKTGAILSRGKTECKVQLEYWQKEKRYRSEWEIRTNRNGNLNERSMALDEWKEELNGYQTIAAGHQQVPAFNTQISGLDYQQFTKSILLAQGEFARLLSAKKEERYALMERITGNKQYRTIGKNAFQLAKLKLDEIENKEQELKGIKVLTQDELIELQNKQLNQEQLRIKYEVEIL